MSLSRLALRLAAVEALAPSGLAGTGPYPTGAGGRVYDSRITPIADADAWRDFVAAVEGQPIVTVYTEEQETDPQAGDYPADREMVELTVEIMIAAKGAVKVENPDGSTSEVGSIEARITDPAHEALLDMIEQQVRFLLDPSSSVSPQPYAQVAMELHHVKSAPLRDATDRLSRVAARTVTFRLRVKRTYPPRASDAPADIAALPEPLLTVARAVAPDSPAGQLLRGIARGQAIPPAPPDLRDIRIVSNLDRGVAPTEKNADLTSDVRF